MEKDLSVIIVNYKSASLIKDCLGSIYAGAKDISFEIIVVDNDSKDDSKELVLATYPQVRWIEMGYNSGFARANNEGIKQSNGRVVLLLNSDTLILDNAIENCLQKLEAEPFIACGVQLLNRDMTPQISGNYFMRGGLNYLLPLPYLGNLFKMLGGILKVKKPNLPDSNSTIEVDWINGAFLMVKKSVIEQVGLLDEDFFLYAEEAEWCARLKKAGRLCIFGEIKIIHLQGETAVATFSSLDKSYANLFDRKGLQIMLSNLLRIRKQFGKGWFILMLLFYVMEIPVFFLGLIFSKIFSGGKSKYSWTAFTGYTKNMMALLKLSFTILRNKPYFYKVL
jgi:GT2 family glycosyltransferase